MSEPLPIPIINSSIPRIQSKLTKLKEALAEMRTGQFAFTAKSRSVVVK